MPRSHDGFPRTFRSLWSFLCLEGQLFSHHFVTLLPCQTQNSARASPSSHLLWPPPPSYLVFSLVLGLSVWCLSSHSPCLSVWALLPLMSPGTHCPLLSSAGLPSPLAPEPAALPVFQNFLPLLHCNVHFVHQSVFLANVEKTNVYFPAYFVNFQQSLVCNSVSPTFPKLSYLSLGNEGNPRPWPCDLGSRSILMTTRTLRLLPCRDHCERRHLCTVPLRTDSSNLSKCPFHSPRRSLPHSVANYIFIYWWWLKFLLSVLFGASLPFLVKQTRFLDGVFFVLFLFLLGPGTEPSLEHSSSALSYWTPSPEFFKRF